MTTLEDFGYSGPMAGFDAKMDFYTLALYGLNNGDEKILPLARQNSVQLAHMIQAGYITADIRNGALYVKITPKGLKFFEWYRQMRR